MMRRHRKKSCGMCAGMCSDKSFELNIDVNPLKRQLIDLVREKDYLYNTKSRYYKEILKRDLAWAEIALKLDRPVDECKRWWRSLRDRFVREKRKIEENYGNLEDLGEWEFYSSLDFLHDIYKSKKSPELYELDESAATSPVHEITYELLEQEPIIVRPDFPHRSTNKRPQLDETRRNESAYQPQKQTKRRNSEEMDENDLFMKMLAVKTKHLPLESKLRLQERMLKDVIAEILANTKK